jgi:hypothetical protein
MAPPPFKTLAALIEIGQRAREIVIGPGVDNAEMLLDENALPK